MPRTEPLRVAVIGAGPIGIESALYAKALGYSVVILERGEVGENLSRWGHVKLFTPFGMNSTPLGLEAIRKEHPGHQIPGPNDLLTGHEYRDTYLMPLTLTSALCEGIRMKTEVLHVGRANVSKTVPADDPRRAAAPFRLLLRNDKQQESLETADIILDCSGAYSKHRFLGPGGIPALGEIAAERQIAYGLEDILGSRKSYYAGKSVVVIGGGYSAASTICSLATLAEQQPATWIIWLTRSSRSTPLPRNSADPLRERDRLATRANSLATRGEGNVEHHSQTVIDTIESHGPDKGFRVAGRCAGQEMTWEVERVIANVGYRPDLTLCGELHVIEPSGASGVRQPEPNYFLLGAKSLGRDSSFLLRGGFEQIRDLFAKLAGKSRLDLYQGKLSNYPRLAG